MNYMYLIERLKQVCLFASLHHNIGQTPLLWMLHDHDAHANLDDPPTLINPVSPQDALKHHFTSLKKDLIFLQQRVWKREIFLKLIYQYMVIFFNFSPTSNHLHPLQVKNCDSNSRLVVDEDDNGK